MSRTIGQIYNEIVSYKDTQPALSGLTPVSDTSTSLLAALTSASKVALWRLWAFCIAAAIYTHEVLWDIFRNEVEAVIAAGHAGTARWLRDRVLEYQHGDNLVFDVATGRYVYDPVIPSNRIVAQAAVVEGNNGVVGIKVAASSGAGLVALDNDQVAGLVSYVKLVRFAGTRFAVISGDGDVIRINAEVFYQGVFTLSVVQAAVEAAILAYLQGLPFNGEYRNSSLVDVVQAVPGVVDVVLESVQTKSAPSDDYQAIDRNHIPLYGYYVVDDAPGHGLADTISYTAL